jgi:esterase
MKLNFDKFGDDPSKTDLIILHGLYGSASNFRGLAKVYAEHFNVYCLDMRNHGNSPHSNEISYPLMAADVIELMDDENIATANIVGHSMGGKTAMQIAYLILHELENYLLVI